MKVCKMYVPIRPCRYKSQVAVCNTCLRVPGICLQYVSIRVPGSCLQYVSSSTWWLFAIRVFEYLVAVCNTCRRVPG